MNGIGKSVRSHRTAVVLAITGALALLVLSAGIPSVHAQTAGGANAAKVQKALQARSEMHAQNLGLTPDQTKQLVQANGAALQQMQALKANPPSDKKDEMKALKSIMDSRKASLGKFLSPNQMKKMTETNQEDLASLMTLSMDADLSLTNAQMDQIDKANLNYIKKMSSAANGKRKVQAARALKSAQKDYESDLQKALTPDQWKQYQAMQQQKKEKKKE
jgi:hypothetical protein